MQKFICKFIWILWFWRRVSTSRKYMRILANENHKTRCSSRKKFAENVFFDSVETTIQKSTEFNYSPGKSKFYKKKWKSDLFQLCMITHIVFQEKIPLIKKSWNILTVFSCHKKWRSVHKLRRSGTSQQLLTWQLRWKITKESPQIIIEDVIESFWDTTPAFNQEFSRKNSDWDKYQSGILILKILIC